MKAPSWPIVIVSGLAGGVVNWWLNTDLIGIGVFVVMSTLLMCISRRAS